jgi:CheY-like chemotaxis protein
MKVLIAEDEVEACSLYEQLFHASGHDVTIYPDAESALHAYQQTFYPQMLCVQIIGKGLTLLNEHHIMKRTILLRSPPLHFFAESVSQKDSVPIYSNFHSKEAAVRWLLDNRDNDHHEETS